MFNHLLFISPIYMFCYTYFFSQLFWQNIFEDKLNECQLSMIEMGCLLVLLLKDFGLPILLYFWLRLAISCTWHGLTLVLIFNVQCSVTNSKLQKMKQNTILIIYILSSFSEVGFSGLIEKIKKVQSLYVMIMIKFVWFYLKCDSRANIEFVGFSVSLIIF